MEAILKNVFKKYLTIFYNDFNNLGDKPKEQDIFGMEYIPKYESFYLVWKQNKTSSKEDDFVKNYGNPACSLFFELRTLVLEKDDEKVSIKFFVNTKSRMNGYTYFKKGTSLFYLTYNIKTGDIYHGEILNYHKKNPKKRTSKLTKNAYYKYPVRRFFCKLKNATNGVFNETDETLITKYAYEFVKHIGFDPSEITYDNVDRLLYKKNMIKKGFKLPNNYDAFIGTYPILNKSESKKFNGKFIEVIMNRMNFTGGRFKKILHNLNVLNKTSYEFFNKKFGEDLIKKLPDEYIQKILDNNNINYEIHDNINFLDLNILKSKKFIEILKLVIDKKIDLWSFLDHIKFYIRLNKYEKVEWESSDEESFISEHLYYTEKIEYYNNGIYKRTYDQNFVNLIEKEIIVDGIIYKPVVLNDTASYCEESSYQQNCVRTYIKKPASFIVSLRCGSERSTLEYVITKINDKIKMTRIQSLTRFNKSIPEHWNPALNMLDEKINYFLKKNEFIFPKITVSYKNGKTLSATLKFNDIKDDEIKPFWDTKNPSEILLEQQNNFAEYLIQNYANETPF